MPSRSDITDRDLSMVIPRIIAIVTGAILLKFGLALNGLIPVATHPYAIGSLFLIYGTALGLISLGLLDMEVGRWSNHLAYWTFLVTISGVAVAFFTQASKTAFGTDAILFARYSVDLLLSGQNPYAHSMAPAFERYPVADQFVTFKRDGTIVDRLSYPAMSFLWFVPQAILGVENLNLTPVLVVLVVLLLLIYESPRPLALFPVAVMFADPSIMMFSYGGVFDILWVLPFLVGMRFWVRGDIRTGAFVLGLAFATKQTPWFVAPFLAVWIYNEAQELGDALRTFLNAVSFGFLGFILPNLPFLLWNPSAWIEGVLTPVRGGGVALVKQGVGLTLVSVSGLAPLPKTFYSIALLGVTVTLLVAYILYYDRLKWAMWIVPAIILWFNYRSLQNYFTFFIPVAYYAVLLMWQSEYRPSDGESSPVVGEALWKPHEELPSKQRRGLLVGVSGVVAATTATAAVVLAKETELAAEIELNELSDPVAINRVTEINLTVTNDEDHPIRPQFHILHSEHQTHAYWTRERGPEALPANQEATYVISPPDPEFAIPFGAKANIAMNDESTEREVRLPIRSIEPRPYTHTLNPRFDYWEWVQMEEYRVPYRWQRATESRDSDTVSVEETADGSARLYSSAGEREEGPWALSGLLQNVPLPRTLSIEATPETVVPTHSSYPPNPNGVEIADRDHRIWIVFADVDERVTRTRDGELTYVIVFVPASPGERTSATVDISAIYEEQGWDVPPETSVQVDGTVYEQRRVSLLTFAATYPETDSESEIIVHRLETDAGER